jgi:predicted Rossmann fold nucleotide-binding protein DprA/Smf involved in DNA uptake
VGVLGHGFEHAYPPQNQRLRDLLEQHGILLTEYPPSFPPARWTFPERNRIIAGMCQAVVVVEAGPRSGSLHTARFANEAGRDVWVVPNRPGTPNSAGVLSLLRDGANPMVSLQEFLDQLQADLGRTHPLAEGVAQPQALPESLVPFLLALAGDEQATPSMLCQTLECSPPLLAERLAELEIRGVVQRRFDGCWEVVRWELVEQALQMGWQRDPQGIT